MIIFLSFSNISVADAEDISLGDINKLIILEKNLILESNEIISGFSYHNLPYFNYRIESYNELGYSKGVTTNIFSDVMNSTELEDLWYWEIMVDFPQGGCSCKLYIYQLDYNYQVLASTVISVWITDESNHGENLFYPVIHSEFTEDRMEDNFLQLSSEFNFLADIYFPPSNSSIDKESLVEYTKASIYRYGTSELISADLNLEINYVSDMSTDASEKIIFSAPLGNISDGYYSIQFQDNIFSLWALEYHFEIDRTEPIVIINGQSEVLESIDLVYIDAKSSHDPILDYAIEKSREIEFLWVYEDPSGVTRVLNKDMIKSPSMIEFIPEESGEYKFTVFVKDLAGNENQSTHLLNVKNVVPEAIVCDIDKKIIEDDEINYDSSIIELFFSAELSTDSLNEINELQFGWYLNGLLYSSNNTTSISLENLGATADLELIVKDSDGDSDRFLLTLNKLDYVNNENSVNSLGTNFFNGLNLVLLTIFICTLILLVIRKKSYEVDPLPKWSRHNKKE